MANRAKENDILDLAEFGAWLADLRRKEGYSSPEKLSAAIKEKTGMTISHRSIYRLEHGESTITLPQLVAISITLFDEILSPLLVYAIKDTASMRYKLIESITMYEVIIDEFKASRSALKATSELPEDSLETIVEVIASFDASIKKYQKAMDLLKNSPAQPDNLNLDMTYLDRTDIGYDEKAGRPFSARHRNHAQPAR